MRLAVPLVRRPSFEYPDDFDPRWTPRFPELAAVANAVSLAMPHAEPFVVATMRDHQTDCSSELNVRVEAFISQESSHHAQHYKFNRVMIRNYRGIGVIDSVLNKSYGWLGRRSSHLRTGFAAGFEMLAFCVASWMSTRSELLMRDANPEVSRLFLWHLGEEVEHRGIADDVHRANGGGRGTYALGLVLAFVMLAIGTFSGAVLMLAQDRRLWKPIAWGRLLSWGVTFLWQSGPLLLLSFTRRPEEFSAPSGVMGWVG